MFYNIITDKVLSSAVSLKRLLCLLICFASVLMMSADKYKIIKLSTPSITIGGKTAKVGSVCNDIAEIKWTANPQSMTVKNLTTGRVQRLTRRQMESKSKAKSLKEFYLRSEKLSTRRVGNNGVINFIESDKTANFPERRLALVIGNSDYTSLTELKNPINDASALADKLLDLGFDVIVLYDASYQDLRNALMEFSDKAVNYKAAVFYYSGHGIQSDNRCYLIPVESKLELHSDLNSCLECNDVLSMLDATRCDTRIAFFDACRDVKTTWTRSVNQEVSNVEASPGTMVFFSTRSGRVAQDGDGNNSPFATSLLRNIDQPIAVSELASRLVKETYLATNQVQYPINSGMLLSDFQFNPNGSASSAVKVATPQPSASASASASATPAATTPAQTASTGTQTSISVSSSDFNVRSSNNFTRSGNDVTFDLFITNKAELPYTVSVVGNIDGHKSEAFDCKGTTYDMPITLLVYKDNQMNGGASFTCPPNVPIKITIRLKNVPASVTYFPLINIALKYKISTEYGKIADIQIKNLSDGRASIPVTADAPAVAPTAANGNQTSLTINQPGFGVRCSSNFTRSGNDVSFNIFLTNKTEQSYTVSVVGNIDGHKSEAFDSNGTTYDMPITLLVYKDNQMNGGASFTCPPNVPIKFTIMLKNVPPSVTYFPLINIALKYKISTEYGKIADIQIKNLTPKN